MLTPPPPAPTGVQRGEDRHDRPGFGCTTRPPFLVAPFVVCSLCAADYFDMDGGEALFVVPASLLTLSDGVAVVASYEGT